MSSQQPLELILARNLLARILTPAFLVDQGGTLLFYNEAAGSLIGRRFEETGSMPVQEWSESFGPLDSKGQPIPYDELPATRTLRRGRPTHDSFVIRRSDGVPHRIEASAVPIVGPDGSTGAIVVFWPVDGEGETE